MYIRDVNNLGVAKSFEGKSPAALEEITAVMLETARKGMWKASPEQLSTLAQRHLELVAKYGASGGGMSADNKKLRSFISKQLSPEAAKEYQSKMKQLDESTSSDAPGDKGMVMKKETVADQAGAVTRSFNGLWVVAGVAVLFLALLVLLRLKRRRDAK